jgi:hypothetical protein
MAYAFSTICLGIGGYFILAWKKRMWPMVPREE